MAIHVTIRTVLETVLDNTHPDILPDRSAWPAIVFGISTHVKLI